MDEFALEIQTIRQTLTRLKAERADAALIEEYEEELRNLTALYEAALEMLAAGTENGHMRAALAELGFGQWTLPNVYSFVYEVAMDVELDGQSLAQAVRHLDFAGTLFAGSSEGGGGEGGVSGRRAGGDGMAGNGTAG